jgi:hypothetical protein
MARFFSEQQLTKSAGHLKVGSGITLTNCISLKNLLGGNTLAYFVPLTVYKRSKKCVK